MSVYILVKMCMLYGNSSFSCMETFACKGLIIMSSKRKGALKLIMFNNDIC